MRAAKFGVTSISNTRPQEQYATTFNSRCEPPAHEGEDLTLALAAVEAVAELIDVTGEVLGAGAVECPAQPPHARSEAVLESPRDRDVVEIL